MSVSSSTSREQYAGNNSIVTAYVVPFEFAADADLVVVVTDEDGVDTTLTLTSDYVLTGAGNPSGGSFVTLVAVPATSTVTVYSLVTIDQQVVYVENADFPAKTQEGALDKLTRICQQLDRAVKAAFRFRETDGDATAAAKVSNSLFGLSGLGAPVFRTPDQVTSWLSLPSPVINFPTKTWIDDGERAAAVPNFVGQFGSQQDDSRIWVSDGLTAGDWVNYSGVTPAPNTITTAMLLALAVTDAKLAADAVTTIKLLNGAVTAAKLAASIDFTGKTLAMSAAQWAAIAPSGAVLQKVVVPYTTATNITSGYLVGSPAANYYTSEFLNTYGAQIWSQAFTPLLSSSKVSIEVSLTVYQTGNANIVCGVFKGAATNAFWHGVNGNAAGVAGVSTITFTCQDTPAGTQTYKIRLSESSARGWLNSNGVNPLFGGKTACYLTLTEIKA